MSISCSCRLVQHGCSDIFGFFSLVLGTHIFFFSFIKGAPCAVYLLTALSVQYFWVGRGKLWHCVCTAPSTSVPVLTGVNTTEVEPAVSASMLSPALQQMFSPEAAGGQLFHILSLPWNEKCSPTPYNKLQTHSEHPKLHCKMQESSRASSAMQ